MGGGRGMVYLFAHSKRSTQTHIHKRTVAVMRARLDFNSLIRLIRLVLRRFASLEERTRARAPGRPSAKLNKYLSSDVVLAGAEAEAGGATGRAGNYGFRFIVKLISNSSSYIYPSANLGH